MEPVFFPDSQAFGLWLEAHHTTEREVWVGYFKKESGRPGISYGDSLDEALCWGWIDGQIRSYDEISFKRRFSPRKPRSSWSAANVAHVERLTREGRMWPPGVAAVEAAKADGRWESAYQGQKTLKVPPDLAEFLDSDRETRRYFEGLSAANRYAFLYRLETAPTAEARKKRLETVKSMVAARKSYH